MILAICDPQGAIILQFKKLFLRDKILAKKISRIYEFWTIKELLNACQSISFDCVIFSNEFSEVCFPLANTFFGNERELLTKRQGLRPTGERPVAQKQNKVSRYARPRQSGGIF